MSISNPVYTSSSPAEHIYECVNDNQEVETKSRVLSSNFPGDANRSANRSADYDTIKYDVVNFDDSDVPYKVNASETSAENYEPPSKSKNAKKPISMPVAIDLHHLSTSENLTSQDDYVLPCVVENQFASQDKPQRAENDPYTPLILSQKTQPAVYQELVGQQPPPSS